MVLVVVRLLLSQAVGFHHAAPPPRKQVLKQALPRYPTPMTRSSEISKPEYHTLEQEGHLLEALLEFQIEGLPEIIARSATWSGQEGCASVLPHNTRWTKYSSLNRIKEKQPSSSKWIDPFMIDSYLRSHPPLDKLEGQISVLVTDYHVLLSYPDSLDKIMGKVELDPFRFLANHPENPENSENSEIPSDSNASAAGVIEKETGGYFPPLSQTEEDDVGSLGSKSAAGRFDRPSEQPRKRPESTRDSGPRMRPTPSTLFPWHSERLSQLKKRKRDL